MTLKKYIVIPTYIQSLDWSTDFINQTYSYLNTNDTKVICIDLQTHTSIKKWLKLLFFTKNYSIVTIPKLLPFGKFGNRVSKKIVQFICSFIFLILGNKVIIWNFFPQHFQEFSNLISKKTIVIYDCVDFFSTKQDLIWQKKLLQRSNKLFVNSFTLQKLFKNFNPILVAQGFDQRTKDSNSDQSLLNFHAKKYSITIGYIGGINNRINFDLLLKIILKNKDCLFIIWGPLQEIKKMPKNQFKKLKIILKMNNVITGKSKKNQLNQIYKKIDIGIIPYDTNDPFNKNCFPMKFLEYCFYGIPTISTEIEELKRYSSNDCLVSNTWEKWHKRIKMYKQQPHVNNSSLRKIALNNTWEKKLNTITLELNAISV